MPTPYISGVTIEWFTDITDILVTGGPKQGRLERRLDPLSVSLFL